MTPTAKRHGAPKFGCEHLLRLSVCNAPTGDELDDLPRVVNPFHVEGEKAAVLATDVTGQDLQLSLFIRPSGAVVPYARFHTGHQQDDEVRKEVVSTRRAGYNTYG
jgi:hypothetical protein